ncbi:hypothetical protein ACOTHJ_15095 [Achromobacter xylosoxidans]
MKYTLTRRFADGDGIFAPATEADGIALAAGDPDGYASPHSTETF